VATKVQWPENLIVPNRGLNETQSPQKIQDDQWQACENVEPLPDGVRSRQGSSASNSIAIQSINVSHESGTDTREFVDATSEYISQEFLVGGSNITVIRVAARLKINSGTPIGNVEAAIYTDNSEPDAAVSGLDFTDFSVVAASSLSTSLKWYFFTVSTGVALTAATTYHLVLRHEAAGATGTNTIDVEEVTTPSGYDDGQVWYNSSPGETSISALSPTIWIDANDPIGDGTAPSSITDATDIESLSGGNWADKGSLAAHVTTSNAGGSQPVWYKTAGVNPKAPSLPNSKPYVSTIPGGVGTDNFTAFSSVNFTIYAVYWHHSLIFTIAGSDALARGGQPGNIRAQSTDNDSAEPGEIAYQNATTKRWRFLETDLDATPRWAMGKWLSDGTHEIDGVNIDSLDSTGTPSGGTMILEEWFQRTINSGTIQRTSAWIAEVLVFNSVLSAANQTTVENYLSGKWGVAGLGGLGTWTAVAAADLNFRIYSGVPSITGIMDYRHSDASTQRHLVAADGEVYKNVSGAMTAVSARERLALTSNANNLISSAIGNDRVFLTNNAEISKKFYVLSGTEYWENEGIAAPTATPTLGVAATNALPDGVYEVDYYYWNDDIGLPSDRRYNGVDALTSASLSSQHITISGLPATTVRENDRATHIRIELKEVGSTIFRLVKEITLGTTSTTIGASDLPTTVEAEYEHAVAPVHRAKAIAENRQFILNVTGSPWKLQWSAIIGTTPYYESFPALNSREFGKGDGDYGTALFFIPPRSLVVGFRNSIVAIDARRPGTSDRLTISKGIGIAGPQAGIVVGSRLFFVSDGDKSKGMFVWQPGMAEPQPLLGVDSTFKGYDKNRYQYASCAHMAPGDDRFQWWTLLSSTSASGDRILVYDYALQAWSIYSKPSGRIGNVLGEVEEAGEARIYLGGRDGVEYLQDTGSDDAGTAYSSTVDMKAFDFGAQQLFKRLRYVDYLIKQQSSTNPTLTVTGDYSNMKNVSLDQLGLSGTFTLGTSVLGGTDRMGGAENVLRRTGLRLRAKVIEPNISGDGAWHLRGISFAVQATRKR
jgi:hypothetical protein